MSTRTSFDARLAFDALTDDELIELIPGCVEELAEHCREDAERFEKVVLDGLASDGQRRVLTEAILCNFARTLAFRRALSS